MIARLIGYIIVGLIPFITVGQTANLSIENYLLEELLFEDVTISPQNWSILQDANGIIYVGNTSGLLEFDGVQWNLISGTENKEVLSLALSNSNNVLLGMAGDFGMLVYDKKGFSSYKSLSSTLCLDSIRNQEVWSIIENDSVIYFVSKNSVYGLSNQQVNEYYRSKTSLFGSGPSKDGIYTWEENVGIIEITSNKLNYPEFGKAFKEKRVNSVWYSSSTQAITIATATNGVYFIDSILEFRIPKDLNKILNNTIVYKSIPLVQSQIAWGTIGKGLIITDENGHSPFQINSVDGVLDNSVLAIYQDRDLAIWLGLQSGLSRIDYKTVSIKFGKQDGIDGITNSIALFDNDVYIGTSSGLYILKSGKKSFVKDTLNVGIVWHLLTKYDRLFIGSTNGIFVKDSQNVIKLTSEVTFSFGVSHSDDSIILVGLKRNDGIGLINLKGNQIEYSGLNVNGIDDAKSILEHNNQIFIISHNKAYRLSWPIESDERVRKYRLDFKSDYLFYDLFKYDAKIYMATSHGLLGYNSELDSFQKDYIINIDSGVIHSIAQDRFNQLWVLYEDKIGVYNPSTKSWNCKQNPSAFGNHIWTIQADSEKDIIWVGSHGEVFKYNFGLKIFEDSIAKPLLRQISIDDSVIVRGLTTKRDSLYQWTVPDIRIGNKTMRFVFVLPVYNRIYNAEYSVRLLGFNNEWSKWTSVNYKDYTNLSSGEYEFQFRARLGSKIGSHDSVYFKVTPPWYSTVWAIIIFLVFIILIVVGVARLYYWRLSKQKWELKKLVGLQTKELVMEREKLQTALLELDKLSLVARESVNGVKIVDTNGSIEWVNEGFTRLTGLTIDDLNMEYGNGNGVKHSIALDQCIQEQRPVTMDSELNDINGGTVPVTSTYSPIFDQQGNVTKIVVIDTDIRNQKAKETELRMANQELETFVQRASHDLKNPIGIIKSVISTIEKSTYNTDLNIGISKIKSSALKLEKLLQDLLLIAKVQNEDSLKEEVNVLNIVSILIEDFKSIPKYKTVNVTVKVDEGSFYSSGVLIQFIMQNLLENAFKYQNWNRRDNKIEVKLNLNGQFACIQVFDNGLGIDKSIRHQVTGMFYRGNTESDGTGLGLYIVELSVKKPNGILKIDTDELNQTVVSVTIPVNL